MKIHARALIPTFSFTFTNRQRYNRTVMKRLLTGQPPNVFVEAGFALKHHEKNRPIFLFEPRNRNDKVPFDLTTFKYVPISQAAEIPNKIKNEIIAILRNAGAPI